MYLSNDLVKYGRQAIIWPSDNPFAFRNLHLYQVCRQFHLNFVAHDASRQIDTFGLLNNVEARVNMRVMPMITV